MASRQQGHSSRQSRRGPRRPPYTAEGNRAIAQLSIATTRRYRNQQTQELVPRPNGTASSCSAARPKVTRISPQGTRSTSRPSAHPQVAGPERPGPLRPKSSATRCSSSPPAVTAARPPAAVSQAAGPRVPPPGRLRIAAASRRPSGCRSGRRARDEALRSTRWTKTFRSDRLPT